MNDGPEWFAPKHYGMGAGRPIAWQGWAVTGIFIASIALATLIARYTLVGYFSIVTALTIGFVIITRRTTRGGWRWRWGERD